MLCILKHVSEENINMVKKLFKVLICVWNSDVCINNIYNTLRYIYCIGKK